jgi:hypothetical protein
MTNLPLNNLQSCESPQRITTENQMVSPKIAAKVAARVLL